MRSINYYATNEEFQKLLAQKGFVPVKYKDCNCHGSTDYFINEECDIIHVLSSRKRAKKEPDVAYTYYKYKPEKSKNNAGYHLVYIGFSALLHRVMAYTFLGNPTEEQRDINHINHNKDDNRACNLEYCTHKYNMHHHFEMKKAEV